MKTFNPTQVYRRLPVPNCIVEYENITGDAKLLLAKMLQDVDPDGYFRFDSTNELGETMGLTGGEAAVVLVELEYMQFIKLESSKEDGHFKYSFLAHEVFESIYR